MAVHLDETSLHAHFELRAYNDRGVPVSKAPKTYEARLAKKQEEQAEIEQRQLGLMTDTGLYKQMCFLDIDNVTKLEGKINEMHIGLGGSMNALFLKNLGQKTHRGLEGRVEAGKSGGGRSYRYTVDRQPLTDGTFSTGELVICPAEAAVVRRIFADYDKGLSTRAIAYRSERGRHSCPSKHQ